MGRLSCNTLADSFSPRRFSQNVAHPNHVGPSSLRSIPKNDRSISKADTPIQSAGKSALLQTHS